MDDAITAIAFSKLQDAAKEKGVDPNKINPAEIKIESANNTIKASIPGLQVEFPAPSQKAIDSWLKKNGTALVGGLIAIGGTATLLHYANKIIKTNNESNIELIKLITERTKPDKNS
ncbi:hypothetical protein [Ectopseudomonas mendocina]|uniref:hypothetical protein n=1 Tax=Ectopseudomonas mendocina TaxID=300 RepID=UPI00376F3A3C